MSGEVIGIYAAAVLLVIGSAFVMVGVIGLLKFNDPMTRLHAPTKVGTLGIGALLLASMVYSFATGEGSLHEMLIMGFLFVTAPISANFIAKVNIHRGNCVMPAEPPNDGKWATLNVVQDEATEARSKT